MISAGELGWPVRTLIKLECQTTNVADVEDCKLIVEADTDVIFFAECSSAFHKKKQLAEECVQQLGSTLWGDLRELKRKLKGRTAAVGDHLPESLHSLYKFVQQRVKNYQKNHAPPPPDPATQRNTAPPTTPPLWEQPLSALSFQFTHLEEWRPVQTEIVLEKEGVRFRKKIEWSYWLRQNVDGSYTAYWTQEKKTTPKEKTTPPTDQDKKVTFQLVDNHYPENLMLFVEGSWEGEAPAIQALHLLLKPI